MSAADPEPPRHPREDPGTTPEKDPYPDPRTLTALAAILALDPATAARVRGLTPARRRPQRQTGPLLELGDTERGEPADG